MYRIVKGSGEAEIEVKKSRFIAAVKSCRSEEEARAFIESVRKKHYDARHNCFAFRIGDEKTVLERQSDDGEPQQRVDGELSRLLLYLLPERQRVNLSSLFPCHEW